MAFPHLSLQQPSELGKAQQKGQATSGSVFLDRSKFVPKETQVLAGNSTCSDIYCADVHVFILLLLIMGQGQGDLQATKNPYQPFNSHWAYILLASQ